MNKDYLKIREDLEKLGITKGDKVLIHSSFKSLGPVEGGIDTLIKALKDTVTEEGVLMFPCFSYDYVNKNNPVFDVRYTGCNVGYIPVAFSKTEGAKRSLHPTHSVVVWGKNRDYYLENHHLDDTCVGPNSPIYKLKDVGGKILMLGCSLNNTTLVHGIEIYYRPPYALAVDYSDPKFHREYTCIDENDNIYRNEFRHVFMESMGYMGNYSKLDEVCDIKKGNVLQSKCYLMDAKNVWDSVLEKMKENPYFFVKAV